MPKKMPGVLQRRSEKRHPFLLSPMPFQTRPLHSWLFRPLPYLTKLLVTSCHLPLLPLCLCLLCIWPWLVIWPRFCLPILFIPLPDLKLTLDCYLTTLMPTDSVYTSAWSGTDPGPFDHSFCLPLGLIFYPASGLVGFIAQGSHMWGAPELFFWMKKTIVFVFSF